MAGMTKRTEAAAAGRRDAGACLVRPAALRPGDTVAVVAPGGPVDPARLETGLALLRSWGLEPRVMAHVLDRYGYLAGRDDDRLADLDAALTDESVRGVVCARGGYGCQRIVDRLDVEAVARDPKVVVGFSDVTALHLALGRRAGMASFHGPMAAWNWHRTPAASADSLRRLVMDPEATGDLVGEPGPAVRTVAPGSVEGVLVGGNLSLVCASVGTADQPDTRGRILLLEEVGEAPYRIDRMLRHLRRAGLLDGVAGAVVGESVGCDAAAAGRSFPSLADVLDEALGGLGVPVLYGLPLGHGHDQRTVPLGVPVRLDADAGRLRLVRPATVAPPESVGS